MNFQNQLSVLATMQQKASDLMKKSNNKASQHKIKRAEKNKKRIKDKPYYSRFERQQIRLREEILRPSLSLIREND